MASPSVESERVRAVPDERAECDLRRESRGDDEEVRPVLPAASIRDEELQIEIMLGSQTPAHELNPGKEVGETSLL